MVTLRVRNRGNIRAIQELFVQLQERIQDGWTINTEGSHKDKATILPYLKVSLVKAGSDESGVIDVTPRKSNTVVAAEFKEAIEEAPVVTEQEAAAKQQEKANTEAGETLQAEKDAIVEKAEKPKAKSKSKPKAKK